MAQTITANITGLLIEDPDCGPDNVINCGSSLLNWFCRLNWIGPFQSDLACPYITTRTLVCLFKIPLLLDYIVFHNCLLNSFSVNSIQRVLKLSPGMVRYVGCPLLIVYHTSVVVQILLPTLCACEMSVVYSWEFVSSNRTLYTRFLLVPSCRLCTLSVVILYCST